MIASSRHRRATVRTLIRRDRAAQRARRAVATTQMHTARTWLVASGLDDDTAARFAPAFSRRVLPTATGTTRVKTHGRRVLTVAVKLYDHATFTARLATYRPRETAAAARFAALAA